MAPVAYGMQGSPLERVHAVQRVLFMVMFLNLCVALAKIAYGLSTDATSMFADGVHSVFDAASNAVGVLGIMLASRPADESHPYGHAKFETYASFAIGILLLAAAVEVGWTAIGKLQSGVYSAIVTPFSFIIMIGTLAANIWATTYERRQARELNSEILKADSSHTLSDALVTSSVTIGLVFVALGFPVVDPVMALVVMVAIVFTAIEVFKNALKTLSDHARIDSDTLIEIAKSVDGVKEAHHARTRGTENDVLADLHILVDPNMTVADAHALARVVGNRIKERYPTVAEVLVHIEPNDGHVD